MKQMRQANINNSERSKIKIWSHSIQCERIGSCFGSLVRSSFQAKTHQHKFNLYSLFSVSPCARASVCFFRARSHPRKHSMHASGRGCSSRIDTKQLKFVNCDLRPMGIAFSVWWQTRTRPDNTFHLNFIDTASCIMCVRVCV